MSIPLAAILLVVGSALAFSSTDMLRKILGRRMGPLPLLFWLAAGAAPFFALWWLVEGVEAVPWAYFPPGLGSVLLNIASNLAFLEAVSLAPLSVTIPMLSLTPVFTTLLAIPILGEVPSGLQMAGVLAVVLGVFWLNLQGTAAAGLRNRLRNLASDRGVRLIVLVSILWSIATPLDKIAISRSSVPFHGMILNVGVALGVLVILALRGEVGDLKSVLRSPWPMIAAIAATVVALFMMLTALTMVWVGFVETMKRAVGSVMALILGRLVFSETIGWRKALAVGLIGAGVALVLV